MQILHDHQTLLATVRDINMSGNAVLSKESAVEYHEVKEKISSDGSLLMMNPVASGDNMATGLTSAHKLKEELPPLIPCCEGKELQISEELVSSGLSAISVRHDANLITSMSMSRACERMQVQPGLVKHRNSFRCLHRPDLKRVPYLRRMSPDELETLFKGNDFPSKTNCGNAGHSSRYDGSRMSLPPENIMKEAKKETPRQDDGNIVLHPIPETRSGAEDVPEGMRLHGARARLYTSVLAGAKAGDQLDGNSAAEEYDSPVVGDLLPEDEVLNEELQIILPPRSEDVANEASNTNSVSNDSTTS